MSLKNKKILIPLILLTFLLPAWIAIRQLFDAGDLGRLALEHIGRTNGFEVCTAQDFQLSLLNGLEIGQIEIQGQQASGTLSGTIDRLTLEHQFWPLLSGTLQIDQISIEKPAFELMTSSGDTQAAKSGSGPGRGSSVAEAPLVADGGPQEASGLTLSITSIKIIDGQLRTYDSSLPEEDIEIQDFDLDLRDITMVPGAEPAIERLKASGELRADSLRSGETVATSAVGQLEMEQGQFRLVDFKLELPQGEIGAQIHADMTQDPFRYTIELKGEPLYTHTFVGLAEPYGLGPSQLTFTGKGLGPDPADFQGTGNLSIGDGLLPPLPVFVDIDRLLGETHLVGAAYEAFPIGFDMQATRVLLQGFNFDVGDYGLVFEGWVDLEGPLDLQLSLLAPREGLDIKELPREALNALQQEDGRIRVPIQIAGTSLEPEVEFDETVLKSLAKGYVQREVEKEVGKLLQGLFGKDG